MTDVTVLGKRAVVHHGVIGTMRVRVTVGPASGSQRSAGWVADLTIDRGADTQIGYGLTVTDPDALEAAAATLLEAAAALRKKRDGVEKGVWRSVGVVVEECSQYPDSIDWTYAGPDEEIVCMGHGYGRTKHHLRSVRRTEVE